MNTNRAYIDPHAFASAACSTLPSSQYDARNVTGTRFFELGLTFDFPVPGEYPGVSGVAQADANRVSIPIQEQLELFSYNHSQTFRVLTVGVESYSVRRVWNTASDPSPANGFVETDREPIVIVCPQLQTNTRSRYFCMLPSDFGQGLAGGAQVSFIEGNFPNQLDFTVCLLNPIPNDETTYSVNQTRTIAPQWVSQYVRSLTLRLFIKATFEPSRIPVFGLNANTGIDHGGGMGIPQANTLGGSIQRLGDGEKKEKQPSRLEQRLEQIQTSLLGRPDVSSFVLQPPGVSAVENADPIPVSVEQPQQPQEVARRPRGRPRTRNLPSGFSVGPAGEILGRLGMPVRSNIAAGFNEEEEEEEKE